MINKFASSLVLSLGIFAAGYSISHAINNFRNFDRYVEVKGLDEEVVKSDQASWDISFNSSHNNLKELYQNISQGQDTIVKFLLAQGFELNEIQKHQVSIIDNQNINYAQQNPNQPHYTANSGIVLMTNKIDLVVKAMQKTGELLQSQIMITNSFVNYSYTNLNSIKVNMLNKATNNARLAAESFAKNSFSDLGKIKDANQGQFSISSADGNTSYDTGSIYKKVRVVTSVKYFLK